MMIDTSTLESALNNDQNPEEKAHQSLAIWSQIVEEALKIENNGSTYRDLFWEYTEPISKTTIDAAIDKNGNTNWPFLLDLMEAYPVGGDHDIHTPIINAIGAGVINTRMTTSVDKADPEGFEYLYSACQNLAEVPWEDAFSIGWYLGHDEIKTKERLVELAEEEMYFTHGVLETGFVADGEATLELFDAVLEKRLIDPGPALMGINSVYRGSLPRAPRYYEYAQIHTIAKPFDSETTKEFRDILNDHLANDFLKHLNKDVDMNLLL